MKSPHGFLIEPVDGKLYDNVKKIGDVDFVISSNMENAKVTNRIAIVNSTPNNYTGPISESSIVCVHHNVFRKFHAYGGDERFSTDLFKDGVYIVIDESFFMYKNDWADEWTTMRDVLFVTPGETDQYGTIRFTNDDLRAVGLKEGVKVGFSPESEYEFRIDGELLYKMRERDICLIE